MASVTKILGPLPAIMKLVDEEKLHRILSNLINNAIKFTEQGYVGLSVSLVDNRLQIKVKELFIFFKLCFPKLLKISLIVIIFAFIHFFKVA